MEHHRIDQNTDSWFQMRAGKITMSNLHKIMANFGKAFGPTAKQYAVDISIEKISGKPVPSSLSNPHLDRGHEQEPLARELYEKEKFYNVDPGGFFCDDKIGYSPDGLLNYRAEIDKHRAAVEIKSVIPSIHFDNIRRQSVDPTKKWQCIGALHYAKLEWIDFVSYCDDFPEGKKLYVFRMLPENYQEEFKMIDERVEQFLKLVEETKKTILESNYFL